MMPLMDGIEFLTKVKNSTQWQHLPVIMLTARQNLDVKINALRIGVDDYLTKPFREEELKARVANLIKNSQNRLETTPAPNAKVQSKTGTAVTEAQLKWLEKIESIILKEIDNPSFSLTDIAPQLNLSYSGLTKKLKRVTGLTLKQYERSIKLNKARAILKSGQVMTVSEVMHQLGFEHHHYFSKLYKEEFGIMPSEELA